MKGLTWNHVAGGINAMAFGFLATEQLIGETILANLILLVFAVMALAAALLFGGVAWLSARNSAALTNLAVSGVLVLYTVLRCVFYRVPAGYGP